ncbi:MAG: hypothetical protein AMS25_12060 [Gemmatimonas sp. SM23_52]|nr:MAG: hypothetical protein AMS25_12060 [Gemmatimonas sp. SM23_52]
MVDQLLAMRIREVIRAHPTFGYPSTPITVPGIAAASAAFSCPSLLTMTSAAVGHAALPPLANVAARRTSGC